MLHLLSAAINPTISVGHALHRWHHIARRLAEPPRRRQLQRETLCNLTLS
jgi:hypothetical protein